MPIDIRALRDDSELEAWHRAESAMFGDPQGSEAGLAIEKRLLPLDRTVGAFDDDLLVGTAGDYPFDMTLPGGDTLAVAGVTAVSVRSTHRRRGILRRMMEHQLDEVAERGEPIAILNSSESSIYGRFGYGIAQLYQRYSIHTHKGAFHRSVPERSMPLRLITKDEARHELPPIYDACRRRRPGMLSQSDEWFGAVLDDHPSWKGGGKLFVVVADADEVNETGPGYAIYRVVNNKPVGEWALTVFDIHGTDDAVEAQLFRYLLDVDLVGTVTVEARPLDCPLRWWMVEPREVRVDHVGDYLWVRLLDIERCLAARRYPVDDELVIVVDDPFRHQRSGRFRIAGGPDGAECQHSHQPAQLAMDVSELGAIYLGQTRPSALAAAGRIAELEPGALARADAFFGWPVAPHCGTRF